MSNETALRLHVAFDCAGRRYRHLQAALGSAAAQWAPVKPRSSMDNMLRYACAAAGSPGT